MSADLEVGWRAATTPGNACMVRQTPAELAVERERNLRHARDVVDAERAAKVPLRTGRVKVVDLVAQAVTELEMRREHGITGFKTGIDTFDALAASMFQPGRVIGVAASTKVGKTTLLGQWGVSFAAQGVPLLVFSFEDEGTDTMYRWIANVSSGDVGAIRAGFLKDGAKQAIPEAFDTGASIVADLEAEVSTTPATCSQLAFEVGDWTRSWASGVNSGVVIVDQLSHVIPDDPAVFASRFPGYPPPPHPDNTVKLLEWQTAMLQRIARKWNVLVIVALQRNEQDKDWEEPTKKSVRDSRGIAHKLDALVIPWRPDRLPNPNPGPGQPETVPNVLERMWLCVPIARHIQGGFKVEVQWQGAHQRVADLGVSLGADWRAPEQVTPESLAGMAAINAMRTKWQLHLEAVQAAANGEGPSPTRPPATLRSVGTIGTRWALPERRPVDEAVPAPTPYAGVSVF